MFNVYKSISCHRPWLSQAEVFRVIHFDFKIKLSCVHPTINDEYYITFNRDLLILSNRLSDETLGPSTVLDSNSSAGSMRNTSECKGSRLLNKRKFSMDRRSII